MDGMVKGWLVYKMTGSAADLGIVTLAAGVPLVLMSMFGGVIADRVDKQKLLVITLVFATLIGVATSILLAAKLIQFWHFIVLAILQGGTFAFIAPLRQSLVPRLVHPEHLVSAVSLTATSFNFMAIAGPIVAGLLLTMLSPEQVYYVIISLLAAGTVLLSLMKVPLTIADSGKAFYMEMAEGLRFIAGNRQIVLLLVIALVLSFFCAPYIYMMPALALGTLKLDQAGLGLLLAAAGLGALIGSLAAGSLASIRKRGALMLVLLFAFGGGVALVAQFQALPLAMLLLLAAGVSGTALATLNNSLLLMSTPSSLHGRVISVFTMTSALVPIGALPMGAVADHIGIPLTFLIAGLIVVLFAIVLWLFVPAIRKM
jgi:MFS transporter, DHA1 family, staphyloferrin A biosynthesis exporter